MSRLLVPQFARLADYCCLWLLEPMAAARLWQYASSLDLAAHVADHPQPRAVASPLEILPGRGKQSVALIRATGTLMKQVPSLGGTSTVGLRRAIRQAALDEQVSGILLAIDSPGGTVAGTADLAADVKAARRSKPVWAHVDDLAASAAYWVASQADRVTANAGTALLGNVGTVLSVEDTTARNERLGVKELAFSSGPLKVMGGGLGVSEQQATYLQGLVNAIQAQFADAVRKGRGLTDAQLAEVQSGAVYTAEQALRLKLVDGISPLEKTLGALALAK
jgi:signal peptide peptidase SppA